MLSTTDALQNWYLQRTPRQAALIIGAMIGLSAGLIGMLVAAAGPTIAAGAVIGLIAGLYVMTDIRAALISMLAVVALLPFGTLPVRIAFTPSFLDVAMGAFLLVYLVQWMTGRRSSLQLTPVHALIAAYMMWLLVSFVLGMRYAPPTQQNIRQFAETLLSISMVFVLVDFLREVRTLRRLVLAVLVLVGVQAVIAIGLWMLPDATAERILLAMSRIGYPNSGVIRYIEANPEEPERAIGTWVDPNAFGGILAISAVLIAPQVFARRPVLHWRALTFGVLGLIGIALVLTFSRSSLLAAGIGVLFVGLFPGYRRYIPLLIGAALLLLLLPQAQVVVQRLVEGFLGQDLATQMRVGEYTDALRLISRYPITGVGFTGTPDIDLYTDVASMYLIMANQIGLVGLGIFLLSIASVFIYGLTARRQAQANVELDAVYVGCHAALLTAMLNGATDLYFFRLDFHSSITLFWTTVALALASARLARAESTVDQSGAVV
jgi:polysaccharide biosynthesis protein PslJ